MKSCLVYMSFLYIQPSGIINAENVRYLGSYIDSSLKIEGEIMKFVAGNAHQKLLEVPIVSAGKLDVHATVRITVAIQPPSPASADRDPIIGLTDGVNMNGFYLHDRNNYILYRRSCELIEATQEHAPISPNSPVPFIYTLTFVPLQRYGACYTTQNDGYLNTGKFNSQLDISRPLSLVVIRNDANEVYSFNHILIEVLQDPLWAVNNTQLAFQPQTPADAHTDSQWHNIPGGLMHVSVSSSYVWGVNRNHHIYMCQRPCSGQWRQIGGGLVQLDIDEDEIWGVNSNDDIYKRPVDGSGAWRQISGKLIHVSASGKDYIWGVNRANKIYKCRKPCNAAWQLVDGRLKQIDGGSTNVYGVNSAGNIYYRPVDGSGSWRQIPGGLKHITASGEYEVFGVNSADQIWRCKKPCSDGRWQRIEGGLIQCDASHGQLWGVNSGHQIWVRGVHV